MIKWALEQIRLYLNGEYEEIEDYPFYLELEKNIIYDNYDAMNKENPKVTEVLNDEIPELCDLACEIGEDEFKRLLQIEYDKAIAVLNE